MLSRKEDIIKWTSKVFTPASRCSTFLTAVNIFVCVRVFSFSCAYSESRKLLSSAIIDVKRLERGRIWPGWLSYTHICTKLVINYVHLIHLSVCLFVCFNAHQWSMFQTASIDSRKTLTFYYGKSPNPTFVPTVWRTWRFESFILFLGFSIWFLSIFGGKSATMKHSFSYSLKIESTQLSVCKWWSWSE